MDSVHFYLDLDRREKSFGNLFNSYVCIFITIGKIIKYSSPVVLKRIIVCTSVCLMQKSTKKKTWLST